MGPPRDGAADTSTVFVRTEMKAIESMGTATNIDTLNSNIHLERRGEKKKKRADILPTHKYVCDVILDIKSFPPPPNPTIFPFCRELSASVNPPGTSSFLIHCFYYTFGK
ncbi:hypothetical protein CHUAL_014074 [Chamberlinius hualienensis]